MFSDFLICFTAMFVAMDMVGVIPIYLSMTRDLSDIERTKMANQSIVVAFVVALSFMLVGKQIFDHLGIALYDFKMGGGLILMLIALADLLGGPGSVQKASGATGIVPIAVPLITGPAMFTTLILQVSSVGYRITILSMVVNYVIAWVLLRNCEGIRKKIGKDGTVVASKIAALLLVAIAVSMIRSGVFEAIRTNLPGLGIQ